jgi:hypothetical protein
MAKKLQKAQFGRSVEKSTYKTPSSDGGYAKNKTKVVFNKEGDIVKSKVKTTTYSPTGNEVGKLSESKATGTTITKRKWDDGKMTSSKTRTGMVPVKKKGGTIKNKK